MTSNILSETSETELTEQERATAARYLAETRDALVTTIKNLSPDQVAFKPAGDRWSALENLEHVALLEARVHMIVGKMKECPPPPADFGRKEMDCLIVEQVPLRTQRVEAPPPVLPTGRWSRDQAIEEFLTQRAITIHLLSAPALRGHVAPHPVLGFWEGYHWLLATAAHSARHTSQIREVMEDPNFPSA